VPKSHAWSIPCHLLSIRSFIPSDMYCMWNCDDSPNCTSGSSDFLIRIAAGCTHTSSYFVFLSSCYLHKLKKLFDGGILHVCTWSSRMRGCRMTLLLGVHNTGYSVYTYASRFESQPVDSLGWWLAQGIGSTLPATQQEPNHFTARFTHPSTMAKYSQAVRSFGPLLIPRSEAKRS
jgi:hypothetical protein